MAYFSVCKIVYNLESAVKFTPAPDGLTSGLAQLNLLACRHECAGMVFQNHGGGQETDGPQIGMVWEKARLRDRIDATIVHEFTESQVGTHGAAEALAADTDRPISKRARQILRAMASKDKPPER